MIKNKNTQSFLIKKIKENRVKIYLAIVAIISCIIGYYLFSMHSEALKSPEEFKSWILSYGSFSIVMFVIIQVVQVVVFFIPGEITQVAGGYIFGAFWGTILSASGILLGSSLAYLFAKYFIKKYVIKMIEKRNLKRFKKVLDASSNKIIIFIIYLIPGIPKDILVYIAGVSNVTLIDFIIYSSMGRFPWIIASAYFGYGIHKENFTSIIAIGVVSGVLFLIGAFKGHSIIDFFHKLHKSPSKK